MKTIARRSFIRSLILLAGWLISRLGSKESNNILEVIPDYQATVFPPDGHLKLDVYGIGNVCKKAIKSLCRTNITGINVSLINDSIPNVWSTNLPHSDMVCIIAEVCNLQALKMAIELSSKVKDQDLLSVGILINHNLDDQSVLAVQKSKVFDSIILIPNTAVETDVGLVIKTFTDFVSKNNIISFDNEDLKFCLENSGIGYIGTGIANGKDRAKLASRIAMNNLRYHTFGLNNRDTVLINVAGPKSMSLFEVDQATTVFFKEASHDANIMFTATLEPELNDAIRVTVFRLWNS